MTNTSPWLTTAAGCALLLSGMSFVGFFGWASADPLPPYLATTSVAVGVGVVSSVCGNFAVLNFMSPSALRLALVSVSLAVVAYTVAAVFGTIETYRVGTDLSLLIAPSGFYFATWIVSSLCVVSHVSIALLTGVAISHHNKCAIEAPHLCPTLHGAEAADFDHRKDISRRRYRR